MPLVFRNKGTSGTQIEVLANDLCIADIGKEVMSVLAGHDVRWRWNFVVTVGPPGFQPQRRNIRKQQRPASNGTGNCGCWRRDSACAVGDKRNPPDR
jgi:hypothetical protein